VSAIYQVIEQEAAKYPVTAWCRCLGVSRSAFYAWQCQKAPAGGASAAARRVREVFWRHSRRYGSRRIHAELVAADLRIGRHRVRRLMREQDLRAIQPRSFVPRTTDSRHGQRMSPNLLLDTELPAKPNQVIVGDITYLPLASGEWAYLATWLDLYSRMIVGWHVGETMEECLILEAMAKVITRRNPPPGLIVHSDRGGQYVGREFRQLLEQRGFRQSMSRADNAYDNAFAESLFSRYKAELLEDGAFTDIEEAKLETFNYIEGYYNPIRRHSALGYQSPADFEKRYYLELQRSSKTQKKE
jgi:transposase InsO family protein